MFFKKHWPEFLISFLFLVLILFFFLPLFLSFTIPYSGDFTGSDFTEGAISRHFLLNQSLQQNKIPLLAKFFSTGFNFLAESGSGIFYPLNLIFFGFLPFWLAINLSILATFFLAFLFLYLYARIIKISRWGSFLAALTFSFSGYFVFGIHHLSKIQAAIWLPLEFYLIERYFQVRKKYLAVFLSIVLAIQFFAGFPQVSYYSLLAILLYSIFRYWQEANLKQTKGLYFFKFWAIVALLSFGLSAIQFFPTYEFSRLAGRHNWLNYETATLYQYHPANLATFIFPYLFGNPAEGTYQQDIRQFGIFWQNNIYFGLIPFILAIVAIIFYFKKDFRIRFFSFLLIFSLIFAFGKLTFFYKIFWYLLPGIKMYRFPQRILLLSLFSLVISAGIGFDWLIQRINNYLRSNKYFLKIKSLSYLLLTLFIIIIFFDLYLFGFQYNNYLDYQNYFLPPQTAKFLQQDRDYFRIWSVKWMDSWQKVYSLSHGWQDDLTLYYSHRELMPPDLNAIWGMEAIDERTIFEGGAGGVEWYAQFQQPLFNSLKNDEKDKTVIPDLTLKLQGMLNVKYLLSFYELESNGLKKIKEIPTGFLPPIKIYQNIHSLPRIFGVFKYRYLPHQNVLAYMLQQEFDPGKELILEKNISYDNKSESQADVEITKYNSEEIGARVNFNQEGLLFISNVYYPGWQAKIDGKDTEIFRANYAFQTIKVPPGSHQIKFIYCPLSYKIGKIITFITLIIIFIYFSFLIWSKDYHRKQNNFG